MWWLTKAARITARAPFDGATSRYTASQRSASAAQEKEAAYSRARATRSERAGSGSSIASRSARARSSASPGRTRRPCSPTSAGRCPAAPATSGTPQAIASTATRPQGSWRDGMATTSPAVKATATRSIGSGRVEADPVLDAQPRGLRPQGALLRSLAHDQRAQPGRAGDGVEEHVHPLVRHQAPGERHRRPVLGQPQLAPRGGPVARPQEAELDAVADDG